MLAADVDTDVDARMAAHCVVGARGRATVRRMSTSRALSRASNATLLLCSMLLLSLGCDRNVEPYEPGEQPREPDLARIFPGPPEPPGGAGSAENVGRDTGTPDRTALPPSRAEGSATANAGAAGDGRSTTAAPAAPIEGMIELAPELAAARPDGGVLFVIARPQGARGGPPLAVLRIPSPDFPLAFSIGPDDVMIPSMTFAGAISLSARLDADGNAMTRGAGDLSSPVVEPLSPGTKGVELRLSERG